MTARRILVLAPHPDDEVVGCAAAIRRGVASGARFFALYLTTGIPPADALWPWQRRSYAARVTRRRGEALAAAACLGLEPIAFGERPSRTLKSELARAQSEIATALARSAAEEVWVSAWEGAHQDHDAANFLASRIAQRIAVLEYAEYNYAGGTVRVQNFSSSTGAETVLRLTPGEAAAKRDLLALYRSERSNLAHIGTAHETLRPLPRHDYAAPPHGGTLFCERFHWVPFRHPRVDFERHARLRAALAKDR
jgi:LmbE family N-acetylglucosaminyl deacetylase